MNDGLLASVVQRTKTGGGSWTTVRQVVYCYYDGTNDDGNVGDLRMATVEDGDGNKIDSNYYRYYTSDSSTGYVDGLKFALGSDSVARLKDDVSLFNAAHPGDPPIGIDDVDDSVLKPASVSDPHYFDNYFEYDSDHRVTKEIAGGSGCSVCDAGLGTYTYVYVSSGNTAGANNWATKTVETLPDGNQNIVYTNYVGEAVLSIYRDSTTGQTWPTYYMYDSDGRLTESADPSAIDLSSDQLNATVSSASWLSNTALITTTAAHGYSVGQSVTITGIAVSGDTSNPYNGTFTITSVPSSTTFTYTLDVSSLGSGSDGTSVVFGMESNSDLFHPDGSGHRSELRNSDGLITLYMYGSSNGATTTTPGDAEGYLSEIDIQQGELGSPIKQSSTQYIKVTSGSDFIFVPATQTVYRSDASGGTDAVTTSTSYTYDGFELASTVAKAPPIDTTQNGPSTSGSDPDTTTAYYDTFGRPIWTRDPDEHIDYTAYDPATGAVVEQIVDVNTNSLGGLILPTTSWTNTVGLNLKTIYAVDGLGRTIEEIDPTGEITATVYDDVHHEVRVYPGWSTSSHTTTGPVEVTREDREDNYVDTLTFQTTTLSYDGGTDLPDGGETITAANLLSLSRSFNNDAGQVTKIESFFSFNGITADTYTDASFGHLGTNYYDTWQDYDNHGEMNRTVDPNGTITRTVYDGQNRPISVWIGTTNGYPEKADSSHWDDHPTTGYWSPANPGNMVEIMSYVYDGGGVGDGNLTSEIDYPDGGTTTSTERVTDNYYDWRDRLVATKQGVQATESSSLDVNRPITYYDYDNLDEVTGTEVYDGDNVTITSTSGVPQAPSSSLLRQKTVDAYDDQGRVYQEVVENVAQFTVSGTSAGTYSSGLTTDFWYDHRGDLIKTERARRRRHQEPATTEPTG